MTDVGILGIENRSASFGPRNALDYARIELFQAAKNLGRPRCLGVLIHLLIQALNELSGHRGSRLCRER
jgi:hypothetical protein